MASVDVDDSTAIYDESRGALVMLNLGARSVWERCDGTMTVDQIVDDISRTYDASEAEIRDDVYLTLDKLASLGLVGDVH